MNDKYTVWVGGIEVNDCLLPKEEAVELANNLTYNQIAYFTAYSAKHKTIIN